MRPTWRDMLASIQFVLPSAVAVVAAMLILLHATTSPSPAYRNVPEAVGAALLLLAVLRLAVVYLGAGAAASRA